MRVLLFFKAVSGVAALLDKDTRSGDLVTNIYGDVPPQDGVTDLHIAGKLSSNFQILLNADLH